jgi:hypothetical protein
VLDFRSDGRHDARAVVAAGRVGFGQGRMCGGMQDRVGIAAL